MMARFSFTVSVLAVLASVGHAWLPSVDDHHAGARKLVDRNGFSLFNDTTFGHEKRWLPASGKIRGVNLGSLFVYEPWIASNTWTNTMQCTGSGYNSEFDCMTKLGAGTGDATFQKHWNTWVTAADFDEMISYGLNTVRIPLGYWMDEGIVYWDSEHFPRGGADVLRTVCGWASDRGMYIILDMHGAPGAQVAQNSFTGQFASSPGFYQDYQFNRATSFLSWLRRFVHDNNEMRNVGMIEVVNEPLQNQGSQTQYMRQTYYPAAYNAIRSTEQSLGITPNNYVHVQFMNTYWGSGNPQQYLSNNYFAAYDDHRYLKWSPDASDVSHAGYLRVSCHDNRSGPDSPTIVGEFSLSVPDNVQWNSDWAPSNNVAFYKQWFAAQVMSYETYAMGWVFWTWKSELGDYRWSYRDAVAAGVIPRDLNSIASSGACNGY
ncbi:endo-beta-1,6-glucanase [Diplogelasinospora grovesii]|uniref:glucan endo-1,6-beta-glucosidase n=1 Tax=Diplogelasinospora grovesii TaxID=303347 RepID=A0AAN6S436_9PEZI|nr:endo-beta-1,6-glucanase [Diplogelasinospora grovesii]